MCSFRIQGGNKLNEFSPVHSAVFNETWVISVGQQCEWEGWQPMTWKKKPIMRMKSWGSKLGRQSGRGARMWFCTVTENSQLQLLCLSNQWKCRMKCWHPLPAALPQYHSWKSGWLDCFAATLNLTAVFRWPLPFLIKNEEMHRILLTY